jgi:hypothetical protein
MEDNSQTLNTKAKPSILDIKPVEQVEQPQVEEDIPVPEIKEDESIFIQQKKPQPQPQQPIKKKKVLSERQKAHLAKMRATRAKKAQEKKAKQQQEKKIFRDPRPKPEPQRATPVPKDANYIQQPTQALSNQEYLNQFFNNMNRFMEVAQKLPNNRPIPQQNNSVVKKQVRQPQKTPVKQVQKPQAPLGVDFSFYNNYKNPFG